jgi:hypothetical protein
MRTTMSQYGEITLKDGPMKGARIPTHGSPLYGFCLEIKQNRFTRIYKVTGVGGMQATANYVGTLRSHDRYKAS